MSTTDADTHEDALDAELGASLYRRMLLIRGFEDAVQRLFLHGEVYGTTHLYSGQEANAVGFASVLREGDRVACTYRGHGHLLAMGTSPEGLLAELLGRATGVNGGRAGSMNVVDPDHGVMGCYGIVGGSIAAATGAALALRGTGSVAVAYFGDGTTNQAYFFECLNFAKVLDLPVVFVCENNGYGEYTPTEDVTPGGIVPRAAVFELPTTEVDGMDLWAVRSAAEQIVARVRAGGGPEFVESRTYRFVGHSRSDPGKYRPEGELEQWRERDPLLVAAARLRAAGLTDDRLDELAADVDAELAAIEQSALAAPFPEPSASSLAEFNDGRVS
ncbi:MAG TPA: thiamine pyrophosphate-dependent dehydrogenase E1 component subunit alpha [Gaiellaceae bacterium]